MNMANMANMAGMGAMGGPVGAPMPMMNNNGALPHQGDPRHHLNDANRTLLNTYIYEYFMRYGMYDCARTLYAMDPNINVKKDGDRRDENGNPIGNGIGDDPMDTDSKDLLDQKRPEDLPAPNLPSTVPGSCFLYEWFCLFWDVFNSQKGKGSSAQINQYVSHTQQQSRMRQQEQQAMLRNIRPPEYAQQFPAQMMGGRLPNGAAMNMNKMQQVNQLQRAAMANSSNPQAMQMLQQQKASQMQRDPSDMDGNRVRPASPGSTDNAPSPSKRPRLDGAPFNPNQGVMMPNGRPAQGMPGQQQAFVSANPNLSNKASIATYSANLQQHHGNQMPGKPMANAGGPQAQGSPMVPQGPDATSLGQYYNPGDIAPGPGGMRAGGPNQGTGSNHALQDYQMQLMLLEQQNKKRLMMARQEQDIGGGSMQRPEGPGGPPGAPPGPGQNFQGTSPPGGRSGASPNPTDMKRPSQQIGNAANMGSPLPDGAQNRSSPNSMNFMGGNMGPDGKPHFFNGVGMDMAGQMNGMRPPSSHPQFAGQMNQQQQLMAARQQQAQQQGGQPGPGMAWQQAGPNGQMPGQPPQGQVQGTPRQGAMPPPSAPAVAATAANSRNATSSPQTSTAAPPTPQQGTKANPSKKKDNKAKSKAATQKKTGTNANAGATPAAEPDAAQEPPTPATPITPVNAASFAKNQNVNPNQVVANGQPAAPAAPPPVAAVPPAPLADQNRGPNFMDPSGAIDFTMDFANPLTSDNVLTDFDFDSFLHDNNTGEEGTFDFGTGFMEGGEIGAE